MFYSVTESEGQIEVYEAIFKKGQAYRHIKDRCVSDFIRDTEYTFIFTEDFKRRTINND